MGETRRTNRMRKRLLLLAAAGLVLAAAGVLSLVLVQALLVEPARLERERDSLRAAGMPFTAQDMLARYPEIPAEENAALRYEEAFALLEAADPDFAGFDAIREAMPSLWYGEPMPGAVREELGAYTEQVAEVIALLHEAATLPKARYLVRLMDDQFIDSPSLLVTRACVTLLCYAAEKAVHGGEVEEAMRHYRAAFALAASLEAYPSTVAQMIMHALLAVNARSLQASLGAGGFDDAALRELLALLDQDELVRESLHLSLQDDLLNVDYAIQHQREAHDGTRVFARNQRLALQRNRQAMADADLPWWELFAASRDYPDEVLVLHSCMGTDIEARPLQRRVEQMVRTAGVLRIARAAILVELHRLAHGAPPGERAALAPELAAQWPLDPYDGAPLRYVLEAGEYRVYSVGEDLQDDGGQLDVEAGAGEQVYRVLLGG